MSGLNLTVLGSSGAQPAPGDACSGYLVRSGSSTILVDCGSGIVSAIQEHVSLAALDAVVVSHMHPDHFMDLITLRYALRYGVEGSEVDVFLPPGGAAVLHAISKYVSNTTPFFERALSLHEYAEGDRIAVGELVVEPIEVQHSVPSFGMRITDGVNALAYSSDTVPCEGLERVADNASVLMAENALGGGAPQHEPKNHLTSEDAGMIAEQASVGRLVLTHFWPSADRSLCLAQAAAHYSGPITVASPGLTIDVGRPEPAIESQKVGI